ncbi:hypothetical protein DGMP_03760 [Desulfomarina profundi]|uniref:Uncharacterized protein n=2 Tax=Desulfomarina profundi TaxID=2772557 RepID=A0A8D5FE83_9BACT|nr:hypothetical protein DGMP_03760 [Desulfomarina profundi]
MPGTKMEKNKRKKLIDEIILFINYAVPEDERQNAVAFIEKYKQDDLVLALLREFYATLPEAREEAVVRIAKLMARQDVFLLVVSTTGKQHYLYAVSREGVVFLNEYGKEVDGQILSFFHLDSHEDFLKSCSSPEELPEYHADVEETILCPACGVTEGEYHLLGCIVEVCPWCEGQLSNCNCRFEQMGVDELETDEQLEKFNDLLTAKGRIPFRKEQSPAYPSGSAGLDG